MNEWAQKNWKLIAAFAAGALLGALGVRQGYEGFRLAGSEYTLIKKHLSPSLLLLMANGFMKLRLAIPI
ncbi:MAG: hypothetical protein ACKO58_02075, partial [Cyanobium sp.]